MPWQSERTRQSFAMIKKHRFNSPSWLGCDLRRLSPICKIWWNKKQSFQVAWSWLRTVVAHGSWCVAWPVKSLVPIYYCKQWPGDLKQLTWRLLVIQAPAAESRRGLVRAGVGPDEGGGGGEGRWGLHLTRGFLIWNKTLIRTIIISTRENQSHGETNLKYIDWHQRGQTSWYQGISR